MQKTLRIFTMIALVLTMSVAGAYAADDAAGESGSGPVINVNTADEAEFALLPRIGEKISKRIVDYREQNGLFEQTTDLMQVKGIGEKSFELLRPYLVLEGDTTLETKQKAPRRASQPTSNAAQ